MESKSRISLSDSILVMTCNYHLGNNFGIFQGAAYVGNSLILPMRKTWIDPKTSKCLILIETHDVETWGLGKGHKVLINGTEIGRLGDINDENHRYERHIISINKTDLDKILRDSDNFEFMIQMERMEDNKKILSDDFCITRIDTVRFSMKPGWNP